MQLRILFLSSDRFPPFRVDVVDLFGSKMVERGHKIDFILQSQDKLHRSYKTVWEGCQVWVGPFYGGDSLISKLKSNICSVVHDLKLINLCKKNKYHVVLVKDKFFSTVIAALISKIYNINHIFWLSYPIPDDLLYQVKTHTAKFPFLYFIRGFIFNVLMYRVIIPLTNHLFVQTEYMVKYIAKNKISKKKFTAFPMAVSINNIPFFSYNSVKKPSKNKKLIVYIGTLNRLRRMDFLLRVFEKVFRKEGEAKLILIGGGDYKSDENFLWHEAKKIGIEKFIVITGSIPRQNVWQYAKDALVCVSPIFPSSILDCGSPTKLLEYMAMGKAVVANDHPEQKTILSESEAGFCVPYEERNFANAILYLFKHPEQAKRMGAKGREYIIKHKNYDQVADIVENRIKFICKDYS